MADNKIGFTFINDVVITRKTFEFVSLLFDFKKNASSDIFLKIFLLR